MANVDRTTKAYQSESRLPATPSIAIAIRKGAVEVEAIPTAEPAEAPRIAIAAGFQAPRPAVAVDHAARIRQPIPAPVPSSRCACSMKTPQGAFQNRYTNMLMPNVVGQSGTAMPTRYVVTRPPTKRSGQVKAVVNSAIACTTPLACGGGKGARG